MTDPGTLLTQISNDAGTLDEFSKGLHDAIIALDEAEEAWDQAYDGILEDLEAEYNDANRKSVPEHMAVSAARRAHRDLYVTWRNARRRVDKQEKQLRAKIAALSGRQSELKALTEEARTQAYAPAGTQPSWSQRNAA